MVCFSYDILHFVHFKTIKITLSGFIALYYMLRSFQNRLQRSGSFLKALILDVTICMITTDSGGGRMRKQSVNKKITAEIRMIG